MKYNRRIQKWHKKGISLLLILLICISTCSGFAFAEDGVEDKTILTYAEQDGKVAIETFRPTASCTEQWQLSVQSFAEWAIENGYSSAEEAFEVNDMVYVSGEANQDIPASVGAGEDLKATPDGLSLYQGDGGSHYLWRLCKAEQANDEESAEESIWDYFWVRTAQPVAMQEYPKESEQSENTIEETYHVIYDANYPDEATKTAGEVPVDETEYTKGADAEVAGNTGNLTAKRSDKEVYQFLGWTTEQNATEPEYTGTALDEKKLTVNSGADITLFAVWKLVKASDRATGNVCQIIRGAAYDEATGTFSGGTYVDDYPTLQEAVAALEGTGDEVIEMIADYEMADTEVVTVTDKKFYLTTAPKTEHTATQNDLGENPALYIGIESAATIKKNASWTQGSLLVVSDKAECTICNAIFDGNRETVKKEGTLISVNNDTGVLNLGNGSVLQNNYNATESGGGLFNSGTVNITGGIIKNNFVADPNADGGGIYNARTGRINFSKGTIGGTLYKDLNYSRRNGGGVYNSGVFNLSDEATIVQNSSEYSGGGIYNEGGTVNMSGGFIIGNSANQYGGGICNMYTSSGDVKDISSIIMSAGTIRGNASYVRGGGIYVSKTPDKGANTSFVTFSGTPIVNGNGIAGYGVVTGEIKNKNNIHLVSGNPICIEGKLTESALLGVTAEGTDLRKKQRNTEYGEIGYTINRDNIISSKESLERIFNDEDSRLFGYNGGSYTSDETGTSIIWKGKNTSRDYVCKIKDQGYLSLLEAIEDISRNTNDSDSPVHGNAIPENGIYQIEMLVESYSPVGEIQIPYNKKVILTTAQVGTSGSSNALNYQGTPGTYCTIKHSENMTNSKDYMFRVGAKKQVGELILKNITLDGQCGQKWSGTDGAEVIGEANITTNIDAMVYVMGGTVSCNENAVLQNNKGSFVLMGMGDNENNVKIVFNEGAIIQGNSTSIGCISASGGKASAQIKGGVIKDNTGTTIIAPRFSGHIKMSGGLIINNSPAAAVCTILDASTFVMSGGKINCNSSFSLGAVCVRSEGDFKMSGGEIVGNTGRAIGGAVYVLSPSSQRCSKVTISGGKIAGNVAKNYAGGIYGNGEINLSGDVVVSGNASGADAVASDVGEATDGTRDNLYLASGKYVNVIGALDDTAKIGITAEGKDEISTDRMTTGARFGVNGDNTQEVLDSLDHFFRDTNGTAADGIRLYGADGGMLDEGDPDEGVAPTYKVVWKPRQFTLTFDANGGDGTMKEILHDGETPLNLEGNTFTYPGHKFLGWNTKADGSGEDVEDKKQGYEPGMKDITLYAQWESTNNALTVSNVVVDAPEGFSEDFDYKLTVKVPTGSELPTSIDCINSGDLGTTSITLDANGEGKFSLKPGANIILQIPRDATYIIEQTKKNEYQTVNAVNGGTQSNSLTTGEISMDRADSRVVFTNTKLYTLTLHKAMTGDFIDSTREFAFDVTITYADNTTKTEKLTLKKDGSVLLTSPLLRGTKVTITEAAASGYSTSYVVNGDDANKIQGRILTDLLIDGDKDVVCTNHSEIAITGVDTGSSNHLPIIIAGAFLILLLMSGTILRFRYLRKKGEDING